MKQYNRLLAIDPSLTCSGWALFEIAKEELLGVGTIKSSPRKVSFASRIHNLQCQISEMFQEVRLSSNDVLISEGATSIVDPASALKVEQVRTLFEVLARARCAWVPGRVNPRSVQTEILGLKGCQLKREIVKAAARNAALTLFKRDLEQISFSATQKNMERYQDIADALLVGAYALTQFKAARQANIPFDLYLEQPRRKRRTSRYGWGKGEANAFGWSTKEIMSVGAKDK